MIRLDDAYEGMPVRVTDKDVLRGLPDSVPVTGRISALSDDRTLPTCCKVRFDDDVEDVMDLAQLDVDTARTQP